MSAIFRAALLMICLSLYAGAQNRSLALYAGKAAGLEPTAVVAARQELQRLLASTDITLIWKDLEARKSGEAFDQVAVVVFDGPCSENDPALLPRRPMDSEVSLADSSVSNGAVLPFFRVDCGYLAQMLAPSLRPLSPKAQDEMFGRALGRIMAHELYHIVGETTSHQSRGVAKASFSLQDLLRDTLDFDLASLVQMRPPVLVAHSADTLAATSSEPEELLER